MLGCFFPPLQTHVSHAYTTRRSRKPCASLAPSLWASWAHSLAAGLPSARWPAPGASRRPLPWQRLQHGSWPGHQPLAMLLGRRPQVPRRRRSQRAPAVRGRHFSVGKQLRRQRQLRRQQQGGKDSSSDSSSSMIVIISSSSSTRRGIATHSCPNNMWRRSNSCRRCRRRSSSSRRRRRLVHPAGSAARLPSYGSRGMRSRNSST